MINTIKAAKNAVIANLIYACAKHEQDEYEQMIANSQAKLAETTLVPGFTRIYA